MKTRVFIINILLIEAYYAIISDTKISLNNVVSSRMSKISELKGTLEKLGVQKDHTCKEFEKTDGCKKSHCYDEPVSKPKIHFKRSDKIKTNWIEPLLHLNLDRFHKKNDEKFYKNRDNMKPMVNKTVAIIENGRISNSSHAVMSHTKILQNTTSEKLAKKTSKENKEFSKGTTKNITIDQYNYVKSNISSDKGIEKIFRQFFRPLRSPTKSSEPKKHPLRETFDVLTKFLSFLPMFPKLPPSNLTIW